MHFMINVLQNYENFISLELEKEKLDCIQLRFKEKQLHVYMESIKLRKDNECD